MRFRREGLWPVVEMDIAPLIDVVFLMLIFFMLTSTFAVSSGVKIRLPQAATAAADRPSPLSLLITPGGALYLNQTPLALPELRNLLKANPEAVFIRADRETRLGKVVEVWDLCRLMGIEEVSIATSIPEEKR